MAGTNDQPKPKAEPIKFALFCDEQYALLPNQKEAL